MRPVIPHTLTALALAGLITAAPALAQDAQAPESPAPESPAIDLDMGQEITDQPAEDDDAIGSPYILEVSGDWEIRCVRTGLEQDPCALYQLLEDAGGNPVSTVELVNLPEGGQAVAGATIVTPLETSLKDQLTIAIDGGAAKRYAFDFCTQAGCVSRVGFTEADVNAFRRGAEATVTLVPVSDREQRVALDLSLMGFTAGFNRVVELNEANAAAIAAARAEQQGGEQSE